jgi:hypothetical protein
VNETRVAEIYVIWPGFSFQCACGKRLVEGDRFAQLDDDSSTVLCLDCLAKRQGQAVKVGPTEFKEQRPGRDTEWMEFEKD